MEPVYQILVLIFIFFGSAYSLFILLFTIGWFRLKKETSTPKKHKVSVILPVRNEENTIQQLLEDLINQSISRDEFEVLVIDDHSDDASVDVIFGFCKGHKEFPVQLIRNKQEGKKNAITLGIQNASGEIILSVDADCRVGSQWIENIQKPFKNIDIQMVSAPVVFLSEKSFFQKVQSLEFFSLVSSAAGAIGIRMPFMCNGANLAFRKSAFLSVNGFEGNEKVASGDDVFLLHKIKKYFGASAITFLKDRNVVVETNPPESFAAFLRQRKRWASKSKVYKDIFSLWIAGLVAGFNLILVLFLLLFLFNFNFWFYFLIGLGLKIFVDFPILISASHFMQKKYLMWYYLPVQLVYPLYVSVVTLLALFTKNKWKGRTIS